MSQCTSGCGLLIKIKKIISKLLGIRNVPYALHSPKKKAESDYASAVNRGLLNTPKYHLAAKSFSQPPATQTVCKLYQLQQRMVESTIAVLQGNNKAYDVTYLQKLSESLQAHQFKEDRQATRQEITSTNGLKKQLQSIIKSVLIHNGMRSLLNNQQ